MSEVKLYVKVCEKCGRQVTPHVDHNLGASRTVWCDHGRGGVGTLEQVTWKRIEVVPAEELEAVMTEREKLRAEQREAVAIDIEAGRV
jgi:hypothetical protein